MKGDFSRQTANPVKHYIEVLMQQGRVQVDADWNEQQAINRHLAVTEARDVIGPSGVPLDAPGFKIDLTTGGTDLSISAGHIYVDGILCESESTSIPIISFQANQSAQVAPIWVVDDREFQVGQWVELSATVQSVQVTKEVQITRVAKVTNVTPEYLELTFSTTISEFQNADMQTARIRRITTYITQPDYPNPTSVAQSKLSLDAQTYIALVYLDVWQRHLTWLDDADMREVALGGADTTTRVKTVWQVKVKPILTPDIQAFLAIYQEYINLAKQFAGTPLGPQFQAIAFSIQALIYETLSSYTCSKQIPEWDAITAPDTGTLNAQTQPLESTNNPCLLPPSAGYQLLENQLYRVEVHNGSDVAGGPTFKWSRNNGWVAVKIDKISGSNIVVDALGPDDILGFSNVDGNLGWAEIVDDWTELSGQPGQLVQITDIQPATNTITVDATLNPIDASRNPKLRRWDQTGVSATSNSIAITNNWQDLEGGLQVQFSRGTYTTGNYWLIPARTATIGISTGTIEWPQDADSNPVPQPPQGIQHHFCRLGLLLKDPFNQSLSVPQDCRRPFQPLASPAMRILGTSWQNDDFVTTEQLFDQGLSVTVDATPHALMSSQASTIASPMIVTLEMPLLLLTGEATVSTVPTAAALFSNLDLNISINGNITTSSTSIQWNWPSIAQSTPQEMTQALDQILLAIANNLKRLVCVRVALLGDALWSDVGNQRLHLDGQALAKSEATDLRTDQKTPRTALAFPSGSGARASNFESWFYLAPSPLHITSVNFVSTIATAGKTVSSSAGTISSPPIPSSVQFKASEQINAIQFTFNRPVDPILQQSVSVQFIPEQSGPILEAGRIPLEKTTEVSKSPLEAIRILGGLASAASSSPISFSGGGGGASVPVAGSVSLDSNNIIATFTVDPKAENAKYQNGFPEGSYTFSISGTTTPVYATVGTNRIMLDGDFDFLPGGDFSLPFNVVPDVIVSFGNIPGSILRGGIFHGGRGPGEVIHG
jgi:Family of unknown function (DUF6519)